MRESRPAGGGSSILRKLSSIQMSGVYLLYKKVTFKLGKRRVLAYLRHAWNIFSTINSQEHGELDSSFDV